MVKTLVADLRRSCQDSRSNRRIEGSPLLAKIGRREISGDSGRWGVEAGVLDCRRHALAALFYRAIRQPDRIEGRQSICDADLYLNNVGINAYDCAALHHSKHIYLFSTSSLRACDAKIPTGQFEDTNPSKRVTF